MMSRSLLLLTAVGALTGWPALAQTASPAAKPHMELKARFEQMDANHDGFIDRGEATGRIAKNFDALDADHDGKLSLDEVRAGMKTLRQDRREPAAQAGQPAPAPVAGEGGADARFTTMDADGDGRISFAEFTAREKALFDRLDTNHDGYIEPAEWPKGHMGKGGKGNARPGENALGAGTWGKPKSAAASSAASQ